MLDYYVTNELTPGLIFRAATAEAADVNRTAKGRACLEGIQRETNFIIITNTVVHPVYFRTIWKMAGHLRAYLCSLAREI
jgi:hypothetical protein